VQHIDLAWIKDDVKTNIMFARTELGLMLSVLWHRSSNILQGSLGHPLASSAGTHAYKRGRSASAAGCSRWQASRARREQAYVAERVLAQIDRDGRRAAAATEPRRVAQPKSADVVEM
jgi:hypothetical protein